MDHHVNVVVVDAEQLVGLDHLETLVHEGRRVDCDLGAHGPRRMGQRLLDGHRCQIGAGPTSERPTRGGQDNAVHPLVDVVGPEALVNGAVFAVHRQQLGSRRGPDPLDDRARGDQRLLVGKAKSTTGGQNSEGDRQSGETHHAVDGHIGRHSCLGHGIRTSEHRGPRRNTRLDGGTEGCIGDGHHLGSEGLRLLNQKIHGSGGSEGHHIELVGARCHDVEGLGADRTRRTEHGHRGRGHGIDRVSR